jgi:hypothetical protein
MLTPFEFELLTTRDLIDHALWNAERIDDVVIDKPDAAARNRAHCELLVAGHAKFPDHEHVERHAEAGGNLITNRDAASRQREHHDVAAFGQPRKPGRK